MDAGKLTVRGHGPITATCGAGASSNICSASTPTPTPTPTASTKTTSKTLQSKSISTPQVSAAEASSSSRRLMVLLDAYDDFVDVVLDAPSETIGSSPFFVDSYQVNLFDSSMSDSIRVSPGLQASPVQVDTQDSKLQVE